MRKKNRITAFYAENFKAINKGTWFELNDLNILTGANNSGKSTLFKAMKIFTEGFVNGDFPLIELEKIIPGSGYFADILNFHSKQKYFKVGFRYYSDTFKAEFEVIYQFVQGENAGEARFASVEIAKSSKNLISLFHSEIFNVDDKYLIEKKKYELVQGLSNPGQIFFKINLTNLMMLRDDEIYKEHIKVFSELRTNFEDEWIGELLGMKKYRLNRLLHFSRLSDDLFYDFYQDSYYNLYSIQQKIKYFNLDNDDFDEELELDKYVSLSSSLNFKDLIAEYFFELFDEISSQIRFFYNKRLFHIEISNSFYSRIFSLDSIGFKVPIFEFINKLDSYPSEDYFVNYGFSDKFIYMNPMNDFPPDHQLTNEEKSYIINKWLQLFGIYGFIITEELENSVFRVFFYDSLNMQKINIADLGKGHAQLIQFLLALAYKIFILSGYDTWKSEAEQIQTIIHIEEPEAFMHPAWQSKLADLILLLSKLHNTQFLIETHSVYLIQKLQLHVAQGKAEPDNISLLYFEELKKGVNYRRINIRKDGMLKEGFGPGFYDESAMLAIDLLNAQNPN